MSLMAHGAWGPGSEVISACVRVCVWCVKCVCVPCGGSEAFSPHGNFARAAENRVGRLMFGI